MCHCETTKEVEEEATLEALEETAARARGYV